MPGSSASSAAPQVPAAGGGGGGGGVAGRRDQDTCTSPRGVAMLPLAKLRGGSAAEALAGGGRAPRPAGATSTPCAAPGPRGVTPTASISSALE